MSQHFFLMPENQPNSLTLPALEIGPIKYPIGYVRHILRPSLTLDVLGITEVRFNSRSTEKVFHLANDEKIIVTARRHLPRPDEADGVLRRLENGETKWLAHRQLDAINADLGARVSAWSTAPKSVRFGLQDVAFGCKVGGKYSRCDASCSGSRCSGNRTD